MFVNNEHQIKPPCGLIDGFLVALFLVSPCSAYPRPYWQVLDRDVEHLSGGELQRFAIAVVAAQQADVYMIDEPSSYLDVRQRLKAAQVCTFPFLSTTISACYMVATLAVVEECC